MRPQITHCCHGVVAEAYHIWSSRFNYRGCDPVATRVIELKFIKHSDQHYQQAGLFLTEATFGRERNSGECRHAKKAKHASVSTQNKYY